MSISTSSLQDYFFFFFFVEELSARLYGRIVHGHLFRQAVFISLPIHPPPQLIHPPIHPPICSFTYSPTDSSIWACILPPAYSSPA